MKKTKRKLKKKVKVLFSLGIVLIICGVFLSFYQKNKLTTKVSNVKEEEKVEEKTEEKKEQDYEVKLLMVGDALIHYGVYADAKQSDGTYDFKPMLEYTKPISSQYQLAYYNQETVLGGTELGLSSYPRFNSPYEVGDAFIDAGFNIVSLATNHTMDMGETGVTNSVNYWKTKQNVVTSGQWLSNEEREESISTIYEKDGITYAFISYTMWTNGLETPTGKEYLNNVYSDEKAKEDIEKVKDKADFIIVAMHWGTEYFLGVTDEQENVANYLSELGVDLIIGAHPHVVEPVTYINDNKTFVIYSLGNYISDQVGDERLTGLMMEVTLHKHVDKEDNVTTSVESPKAELIYTKSNSYYPKNFRVYPYSKLDTTIFPQYQTYYEKYKHVVDQLYPELTWGLTYEA